MLVKNGLVVFENNEKDIWEKMLERSLSDNAIPVETLRDMGETKVTDLHLDGKYTFAKMAADHVGEIPEVLH